MGCAFVLMGFGHNFDMTENSWPLNKKIPAFHKVFDLSLFQTFLFSIARASELPNATVAGARRCSHLAQLQL